MAGSQGSGRLGSDCQRGDSSVVLGKCGSSLLDKGSKGDCPVCGCHGAQCLSIREPLRRVMGCTGFFMILKVERGKFGPHLGGQCEVQKRFKNPRRQKAGIHELKRAVYDALGTGKKGTG